MGYTCASSTIRGGWCQGNGTLAAGVPAPTCRQCPANYKSLPPQKRQQYFGCF